MKPRVGVSACLIGELVRFDGTHKLTSAVAALAQHFELVTVCPEDEIGMGTPREPIRINRRHRLVGVTSNVDHTDAMVAWANNRLDELGPLDGYVFKARSPSCGVWTVQIEGEGPVGRGIFARVVTDRYPDMPVAEEDGVDDEFIRRVRSYAQRRP
jgi:uncharacterized protein YbbK (DUF523 family)